MMLLSVLMLIECFFLLDGQLSIVAAPNFDYESLTTYTLVFTARDYLYTSDNKTLTIIITDVNETPAFVVTAYTARIPEEKVSFTMPHACVQACINSFLSAIMKICVMHFLS